MRAGLSVEQVSECIKVQVHKIEALERESYEKFHSSTSLESTIRAYASAVGLDAELLLKHARGSEAHRAGGRRRKICRHFEPNTGRMSSTATASPRRWSSGSRSIRREPIAAPPPCDAPSHLRGAAPGRPPEERGRTSSVGSVLAAAGWGAYLSRFARDTDRRTHPDFHAERSPRRRGTGATNARKRRHRRRGETVQATPTNPTSTRRCRSPTTSDARPAGRERYSGSWALRRGWNRAAGTFFGAAARLRPQTAAGGNPCHRFWRRSLKNVQSSVPDCARELQLTSRYRTTQ